MLPKGDWALLLSTALGSDPPIDVADGIWEPTFPAVAVFARS